MTNFNFDQQNIIWNTLGDFENFLYSVLHVDDENKIIDVLFKLSAHKPIFLHRHMAPNMCFVVQGEHRLYEANGDLKEVRPVGSYTYSPASNDPHRECGGDDGLIVLFSIRGGDGLLYEVLDEVTHDVIATLSYQDIVGLYEAQSTVG
ncbi:MAG: regulator [Methylophaga sp.]|nr:regulator [Methylophaga sp.]